MKIEKVTFIDKVRLYVLTGSELFDAWRVVPRILVCAYGFMCWEIVVWYTNLTAYVVAGCDIAVLGELCIQAAPTTQHAALVSTVVGASAGVFGLYCNTGRTWDGKGFVKWNPNKKKKKSSDDDFDFEEK